MSKEECYEKIIYFAVNAYINLFLSIFVQQKPYFLNELPYLRNEEISDFILRSKQNRFILDNIHYFHNLKFEDYNKYETYIDIKFNFKALRVLIEIDYIPESIEELDNLVKLMSI